MNNSNLDQDDVKNGGCDVTELRIVDLDEQKPDPGDINKHSPNHLTNGSSKLDLSDNSYSCQNEVTGGINDNDVEMRRRHDITASEDPDLYKYMEFLKASSKKKIELGTEEGICENDLLLAATLIHDAMEGRTVDIKTEPKYVRSYKRYKSKPLTLLLYVAIVLNLALVLVEYPAQEEFLLPAWATLTTELLCLGYFTFRTVHHAHWRLKRRFIRDPKNIFIISILTLTVIDMLIHLIFLLVKGTHFIRWSRVLRPFYIVNFAENRQVRRAWRNIRRTVYDVYHVIFLFFFFIFVFALIGLQLFRDREDIVFPNEAPYFKTYMECVWELLVLVTTSNNPDVTLPALNKSRFYCIFFFAYIVVSYYIVLNVFLAIAYHSYNENMKREIIASSKSKKRKLQQAFDVVKIRRDDEDMVTYKTWKRLMNLVKPELSKNQIDLLMLILDMNRSGYICRHEFLNVADLLNVPVSEVADRQTWMDDHFPAFYNSPPSECLRRTVESILFTFLFDALIVIHTVFLAIRASPTVNIVFCSFFTMEILMKIYTFGVRKYFHRAHSWFDVIVTGGSWIGIFIDLFVEDIQAAAMLHGIDQIFSILRTFRILRLLNHIPRFKIMTSTLLNIAQSIVMYAGIIFILFYAFAIIGMETFKDQVNDPVNESSIDNNTACGTPLLANTPFAESGYCVLNFNSFFSATLVLATLLYENNWHVVAEGFVLTSNKAARIYFVSFYVCVVITIMNTVTAFIVDMFMHEFAVQKQGKQESQIEKKIKDLGLGIDDDTGNEVSAPLTDNELLELMKDGTLKPRQELQHNRSSIQESKGHTISMLIKGNRKSYLPSLNRFDGIRFHIKKRGMTRLEVLLQQLYDVEEEEPEPEMEETYHRKRLLAFLPSCCNKNSDYEFQ